MDDVSEPLARDPLAQASGRAQEFMGDLRARFAEIDTWVFDLDNTLYPAGSAIWPKIDNRITRYLADLFGIDGASARALQKFYYQRHGTTLAGLIADHQISHEQFLSFVHDIDRSSLAPHPALVEAISALPGRKMILTNGSLEHALRTAERLGFSGTFEAVFDIVAADLVPKPDPATYDRFFAQHRVDPRRSAMFEDIARNLVVPHQRGMTTVLVVPRANDADHREPWEATGRAEAFIDFVTDDIAGFVAAVALARRKEAEPVAANGSSFT